MHHDLPLFGTRASSVLWPVRFVAVLVPGDRLDDSFGSTATRSRQRARAQRSTQTCDNTASWGFVTGVANVQSLINKFAGAHALELRQLRYFVKIIELGSLGRAALELDVGVSALSQQISKLESELCTRLLNRTSTGVTPTSAGFAFLHHAQLTLRQAENAIMAAHRGRMSGYVSVGLPPTTATVLALPLINAMRTRYPDIQLHLVEMLSGHLAVQLNARQIAFERVGLPRIDPRGNRMEVA